MEVVSNAPEPKTFFVKVAEDYFKNAENPSAKELFTIFYKKIQEKQVRNAKLLNVILKLIEKEVRIINVVTENDEQKNKIKELTMLLMKLDREIRETVHAPDAKFLDNLKSTLYFANDFE
jgi:hypothetical protein